MLTRTQRVPRLPTDMCQYPNTPLHDRSDLRPLSHTTSRVRESIRPHARLRRRPSGTMPRPPQPVHHQTSSATHAARFVAVPFLPGFRQAVHAVWTENAQREHWGGGDADGVQLPQVGEDGAVPRDGFEIGDQLQRRGQGRPRHQARQWQVPNDAIRARHRPSLHHLR
jgi:hypothetical protein